MDEDGKHSYGQSPLDQQQVALVVDLDGTLIKSDLLVESVFAYLGHAPARAARLLAALFRGKAVLKDLVAAATELDVTHLPYDARVIALINQARFDGRKVYLASASNERYVKAVADHLAVFDGWFGSSGTENLSSSMKAERLVEAFGKRGFDYIGNGAADIEVWAVSRERVAVDLTGSVEKKLLALDASALVLRADSFRLRNWIKLLRVHQWAKNALVFVPLITAQRFETMSLSYAVVAFFAFSLAASSLYIINDLVDLDDDRKHRSKKHRPLASGQIAVMNVIVVAPCMVTGAILIASLLGLEFVSVLLAYLALSAAYTFVLKRKMVVDVVVLASLYTVRIVGGALAISVPVSEWLLAFSMFLFLALALIKRQTELAGRLDANLPDPTNRNYRKTDLQVIETLSAASGFNAITVFTLYISSESVQQVYAHPKALWLICPILIYWISRILMLAHRRQINDDPVIFALTDLNSLRALGAIGLILMAATVKF